MNKKEQDKFLEELKAERAEKKKYEQFLFGIFVAIISAGLPLTFCLVGLYCEGAQNMLIGGIIIGVISTSFWALVAFVINGVNDEK